MDFGFIALILLFGFLIFLLFFRFRHTGNNNLLLLMIGFSTLELGFIVKIITDFLSIYIDNQLFGISSCIFVFVLIIFLVYEIRKKEVNYFVLPVILFFSYFAFLVLIIFLSDNKTVMDSLVWIREFLGLTVILLLLIHLFRFRDLTILFLSFGFLSLVAAAFLFNTTSLVSFIISLVVGAIILIIGEFAKFKKKRSIIRDTYSIRHKISFSILSLVVVILGLISGYSYYIISSQKNADFVNNIDVLTHTKAQNLQTLLSSYLGVGTGLGEEIIFNNYVKYNKETQEYDWDLESIKNRSEFIVESNDFIYKVKLINTDGIAIYSTNADDIGADKSKKKYFLTDSKETFISDIYISKTTNKPSFDIAMPIFNINYDLLGILVVDYYAEELFDVLLDRTGMGETGEFYLVNNDFYIISPSRFFDNIFFTLKDESINVKNCFNEKLVNDSHLIDGNNIYNILDHSASDMVSEYQGYRGNLVLGTHILLTQPNWCLISNIDRSELRDPINIVLITYFCVSILMVMISGLISNHVSNKISRPIKKLQEGAEIIEKGNLDYKVGINSQDEIGQLSRSFDKMTESIKKSRASVEKKVEEQTNNIKIQKDNLEDQQKAILNILEDVEEEKSNVLKEKNKIDAILHSIGDGVFVIDKDLNIIVFNKVAADISGYSIIESMGKKYFDILNFVYEKDGKTNDRFIKGAMETGEIKEMSNHTLLVKKDGSKVAVADSAAPLKDKDGKVIGCVVVFRDVTQERLIDKAKTEFVSLASHQLRTPLSAINWYAEMILDGDVGKLNKEQKEYLQEIYDSNHRMIELVNSLLNVSRIELGIFAIKPEEINFNEIINEVEKELKIKIKSKKIKFEKNITKDVPKKYLGDRKLLRIIFQNLLSNSIKYSPDKSKVELKLQIKNNKLCITVKDYGFGIPKKDQDKIFQKLFRADNVRETDTDGTGLGLYIIKAIVEQSNGKVWFESEENKGTKFLIELPLSGMLKK